MKWDGSKLVVHLFNNDIGQNTWGNVIQNDGKTYQSYSWNIDFEPKQLIVMRVSGDWSANNSPWNSNIYCRTGDITIDGTDVVWMYGNCNESGGWGTYSMETFVVDDSDAELVELANKKVSPGGEGIEAFGSYSFSANQKFRIKKTSDGASRYNHYSPYDAIVGNLRYAGDNNEYIEVVEPAKYELYFNFDDNSLYITDPVIAEADEWSQSFNAGNCAGSKANWGTHATAYAALSPEAQALLAGKDHVDYTVNTDSEGDIVRAVQRYDYVLQKYKVGTANTKEGGFEDFMGRVDAGKLSLAPVGYHNVISVEPTESNIVIVLFITVTLLSVATGYLVIRRRKNNQTNN